MFCRPSIRRSRQASKNRAPDESAVGVHYAFGVAGGGTFAVSGNPPDVHCPAEEMRLQTAPEWDLDSHCSACDVWFGFIFNRRHHCRNCGESFCGRHCSRRLVLLHLGFGGPERVCDKCYAQYLEASRAYPLYLTQKAENAIFYSG